MRLCNGGSSNQRQYRRSRRPSSARKCLEELRRGDAGLPKDAAQRADRQCVVQWDDAALIPTSHDHMAAALAHPLESEPFEGLDRLLAGNLR